MLQFNYLVYLLGLNQLLHFHLKFIGWKVNLSQKPLYDSPVKSVKPHCIQAPVTSVNNGDTESCLTM